MKDIFDRLGITKTKTTSFHPAGNGACERANKSIVDSLKMLVSQQQTDWEEMLAYSLWAYRTSIQKSIQESPALCVFGFDP